MKSMEHFTKNNLFYDLIYGDSKDIMKMNLLDTKMDLVIFSPPYSDLRKYDAIEPDRYVEWFEDFIQPIYDLMKPNGVLVVNINSRVIDGVRHTYPYELLIRFSKSFFFIEDVIWNKGKMLVNSKSKRPSSVYEHCFVLSKGLDYTWNPDAVRREYDPKSIQRMKNTIPARFSRYENDKIKTIKRKEWVPHPLGAYPKNILDIGSETQRVSNLHTSIYPITLVDWFIKAFTNEGDIVLDPFVGSGTTIISAIKNKRSGIGIEKNKDIYIESIERVRSVIC